MNFREIAREVRKRSGNRAKPSGIQIVNAIGYQARERRTLGGTHYLVPVTFNFLKWDAANSISAEDAERWMTEHLVPVFAAIQAEWDDQKAFRRGRKRFQRSRLAHMREVGYAAFQGEFAALHEERRTREDVDGWLLEKFADTPDDIPEPEVAIPKKAKRVAVTRPPKPSEVFPADAATVIVHGVSGYASDKFRKMFSSGPDWIEDAILRSGRIVRLIGAPDDKPSTVAVVVDWPVEMARPDDKLILKRRHFHRGWGYQGRLAEGVD